MLGFTRVDQGKVFLAQNQKWRTVEVFIRVISSRLYSWLLLGANVGVRVLM